MHPTPAPRSAPKLEFSRYEFKYLLSPALRREVEAELAQFVHLDPFVSAQESQRYVVRSLYWDDAIHTAFHEKIDGMLRRSKFRVRTYSRDRAHDSPVFLEVKGRDNERVFKHRVQVAASMADLMAAGDDLSAVILARAAESPVREAFAFQVHRRRIRPLTLVDYRRRPYVSRFDPEFRLTFDEELSATATDRLLPRRSDRTRRLVPGETVMELKFRHHVPSWFHRIIQGYELRRRSYSKVCAGMEALGIASADA
jgi:hypothetical protein